MKLICSEMFINPWGQIVMIREKSFLLYMDYKICNNILSKNKAYNTLKAIGSVPVQLLFI